MQPHVHYLGSAMARCFLRLSHSGLGMKEPILASYEIKLMGIAIPNLNTSLLQTIVCSSELSVVVKCSS